MPTTIAEAIEAWRAKQQNGTWLMRTLVSHDKWIVPLSEAAAVELLATNALPRIQYNRDQHGVNRLMLWSSPDTYATYAKGAGVTTNQHTLTTTGVWVFQLPLDGIDAIWIDPLNAHDILYDKQQFARLRDFAAAVSIERDIAALRAGTASDGAVVRVREYQNYLLPVARDANGGRSLLMAPDSQGRALAAVFTAADAYDAFEPQQQGGEVDCVQLSGERLFGLLANMDLTGIVFNCKGPIAPVAFAAGLSRVVLDA